MFKRVAFVSMTAVLFAGCASVPMASKELSNGAKLFNPPQPGNAGLYIYRGGGPGGALKKDIWVDGQCVGESAPNVFFYKQVAGNQEHTVSTESEFSPNKLKIFTKANANYFVRQYMKMGLFVGGANLEVVDEATGEKSIKKLGMAVPGACGQ